MSVQAAKKQAEDLAFSDESLGYYEVDQAFGFLSNLERQMNPDDPKLQLLLGNPYSSHEEEEKVPLITLEHHRTRNYMVASHTDAL